MKHHIILDLCGGTGSWSKPYKEAGYDVRIITLPEQDIRLYQPPNKVYGILAAPPCTVFASSGARWKRTDEDMREGLSMVDACIRIVFATRPVFWVLENPIGTLRRWLGPPQFYFNPSDYNEPYTKRTCLWGQFNIPQIVPVLATEGSKMHLQYGSKSERTKKLRSITPEGFAKAFFEANK